MSKTIRASLARWISDAGSQEFRLRLGSTGTLAESHEEGSYYIALVGELFDHMRGGYSDLSDWARLASGLAGFTHRGDTVGISQAEAALFAATAFYAGGYPASAYLVLRGHAQPEEDDVRQACYDLLARPVGIRSRPVQELMRALEIGDLVHISRVRQSVADLSGRALQEGPDRWIPLRILQELLVRFEQTNIRAVLPDGRSDFWNDLAHTFVKRANWEMFPSQIEAVARGLLDSSETFSLQMPTGSGKTSLCEVLLYSHAKRNPNEAAILLVPYRALAAELRGTMVKELNEMGIQARTLYGGTVPSGDEVRDIDSAQAVIATPEALSALLGVAPAFLRRVSLVVCDEGHLLDDGARGVALELLLARLRASGSENLRFVFASAIVPNIGEVNAWLGGTDTTAIASTYRPTFMEYGLLTPVGRRAIQLTVNADKDAIDQFAVSDFLAAADFRWKNPQTGRINTYPFSSIKTRAIAGARKLLPLGAVAVFAANKRGDRGAIGLAHELLSQLHISLPSPSDYCDFQQVRPVLEYLQMEYGGSWIGTRALSAGAVLHHGDIPQETREIIERLVRSMAVKFVICTSTLAEGVNLPIRSLVLYSVERGMPDGETRPLLLRDIRNLVGRAGRAGSSTKGLVVCANNAQWHHIKRVAQEEPGEPVQGVLVKLWRAISQYLANHQGLELSNKWLESRWETALCTLIDGVDACLMDLVTEEITEERLLTLAVQVAEQTFAARQSHGRLRDLGTDIFRLRAQRVMELASNKQLQWVREAGSRIRMLDPVRDGLLQYRERWDDVEDSADESLVEPIIRWAIELREVRNTVVEAFRLKDESEFAAARDRLGTMIREWLAGTPFKAIADATDLSVDETLGVHGAVISHVLQSVVEQGIAILAKVLEAEGVTPSLAVTQFPECLRYGVPTETALRLMQSGVRHRRAAVELGRPGALGTWVTTLQLIQEALFALDAEAERWRALLGELIYGNTVGDLMTAQSHYDSQV